MDPFRLINGGGGLFPGGHINGIKKVGLYTYSNGSNS